MTEPTARVAPPELQILGGVTPGPNGRPWTAIDIRYGYTRIVLVVPHQIADELADEIGDIIREAAAATRRAELGLIVPNAPAPTNGHPHP